MNQTDTLRAEEWRQIRREIAEWRAQDHPDREVVQVGMNKNGQVLVSTVRTKRIKAVNV